MIAAVILAAGASSRMGAVKALLKIDGETLLARILRLARASGAQRLIATLGPPHGEQLAATLSSGVEVAWNDDPSRGMLSSVQAALRVLAEAPGRGALLWPVDVPLVTEATVQRLISGDLSRLTAPCYEGRGGHPLWLPAALHQEVLALPASASLRTLRESHPLLRIPVEDPGVLRDLDTPSDFARALAELGQR
ncbi:MAG TPA: nucleotidyltransferase family protein [Pseudomonadota bacterium]|nr:nucleotidyltransferase family protein [Pseudomonadota bacterium]